MASYWRHHSHNFTKSAMTMVKNIFPLILTTLRLVKTLHENLKKKLSYHAYEQEKSRPQKIPFQCHSSMERNRTICYRYIVTEAHFKRPSKKNGTEKALLLNIWLQILISIYQTSLSFRFTLVCSSFRLSNYWVIINGCNPR